MRIIRYDEFRKNVDLSEKVLLGQFVYYSKYHKYRLLVLFRITGFITEISVTSTKKLGKLHKIRLKY